MTRAERQSALTQVLIAFLAVLPATIAAIAALMVTLGTAEKVAEVKVATDGMKDALVAAKVVEGHAAGVESERTRKALTDSAADKARAEGALTEKARAADAAKAPLAAPAGSIPVTVTSPKPLPVEIKK